MQAVGEFGLQAELLEHVHEMDAGRRLDRVGKVDAARGLQRRFERCRAVHQDRRVAVLARNTGFDDAQGPRAAGHHVAAGDQLRNQRLSENDRVAGSAGKQAVFHHADSAESCLDTACVLRLEAPLQLRYQTLGRAAAEQKK